ncbi:MAG: WD40 repeat domain-containing protein [Synechococcus sp.]
MNSIEQIVRGWEEWKDFPENERLLTGDLLQAARMLRPHDLDHLPADIHEFIRLSDELEWEQETQLLLRAPINHQSSSLPFNTPSDLHCQKHRHLAPATPNTAELIAAIHSIGTHLSCQRPVPSDTAERLYRAVEGARERGYVALGMGGITALAISPNNQWAAVACEQGNVVLLDRAGRVRHQWQAYEFAEVRSVAFGPRGQMVATGGSNGSVNLWTLEGQPIGSQQFQHEGAILSVAVSPEGDRIASSGTDLVVHIWPIDSYVQSRHPALALTQGGIDSSQSHNHPVDPNQPLERDRVGGYRAHSPQTLIRVLQFEPLGHGLVGGGSDGHVHIWDGQTGQLERSVDTPMGAITSLCIDRNSQQLVCGSRDGELWVQSIKTGVQNRWQAADRPITTVIVLADQTIVTSAGETGSVQWDSAGHMHRRLQGETPDTIAAAAASPCGNWMVCGTRSGVVRLWDLRELSGETAAPEHREDQWQHWLHVACDRLQYHPALNEAQSATARGASRVCSLYGYQDLGGAIPLQH